MKKTVSLIFCFLLISSSLALSADLNSKTSDKTGNYELYNGVYHSALIQKNQSTKFLEQKLFRLNTTTGETWMLIDVMKGGADIKYWKKITDGYPVDKK
ncbi:hypothetical protein [Desulfobacula phenolica]|uniref:Uncharacterized protein n=1 Tax=Desulfobacula phenolica TaxID=90732 RepID=A0A1H2HVW6_9BACT|nr:hypothetical protein [Desulfobacula phenolica]SDU35698.1 hypothetical protein SAMN04487931_10763 [Desulfobacula phenolica]